MNNRLHTLRKDLKITQESFAEKLNITNAHVSALENGKRPLTDRLINDICREFGANEDWLRSGQGNMYRELDTDCGLAAEIGKLLNTDDEWTKNAVLQFLRLPPERREVIKNFIITLAVNKKTPE